jgi:acetyl esterase/lipase
MNDDPRFRRALPLLLVSVLIAACGNGGGADDSADTRVTEPTTEPTTAASTSTAPASSAAPTSTARAATTAASVTTAPDAVAEWVAHPTEAPCLCADGSEYVFHTLERNPDKVMLYYQGGGACFSEEMCSFTNGTYKVTTGEDDHPNETSGGIFDFGNPANPFADWSIVFMPYCTGDVFLGDATTTYGEDLVIEHRGAANARHGLDYVAENYPDAERLFVTGSSAGGVPAPLIAGLASDVLPVADIAVLADASGGYPSNPVTNSVIGALWGTASNLPDWPELEGLDPNRFGIPDLFTYSGRHDPSIRMARYDNAFDRVQKSFSQLAGLDGGLLAVLDANEAMIEAGGVNLDVYVAPGADHTILGSDDLYDLEVEGVAFIDWLTTFVGGGSLGDVHCVECEQAAL